MAVPLQPNHSTLRPFHHGSTAAQGASPVPASAVDDSDETSPVRSRDSFTEQDPLAERTYSRYTFKAHVPLENLQAAIETMRLAQANGLTTEAVPLEPSSLPVARGRNLRVLRDQDPFLGGNMKAALRKARAHPGMIPILVKRNRLPLMTARNQAALLKQVKHNDVVVLLAKTGSGKTTQVSQILLDDNIMKGEGPMTNIVCTQPRRIAATSVAARVARERRINVGETVGYHIRNENLASTAPGSITYCTTGILLNRLISDPDGTLSAHSHIIVDEVHERDLQIDLVLTLLRDALRTRKSAGQTIPKVILMSATIDPTAFLNYFRSPTKDGLALTVDTLDVEGRFAHVETHYLPDILTDMTKDGDPPEITRSLLDGNHRQSSKKYIQHEMRNAAPSSSAYDVNDPEAPLTSPEGEENTEAPGPADSVGLATAVIAHIALNKPDGDILAFFAGWANMENAAELLSQPRFKDLGLDLEDPNKFKLVMLHSLRQDANAEVFKPVPKGCRRIILATNIAETSITLPEVVYVVDTGRERDNTFDHSTMTRGLPFVWVSRTSSIQRRGRAGRVRNGHYYALFTKERYDAFRPMNAPQIRTADLIEVALQLKIFRQSNDVGSLLLDTPDPPSREAVASALKQLTALGALNDDGEVTILGRFLWRLGIHPALGKAVLLGSLFGCLEPMLILACHDLNRPLISTLEANKATTRGIKKQYFQDQESDFMWIIGAFREYHAAVKSGNETLVRELAETKFVRHQNYCEMITTSKRIHEALATTGMVPRPIPGRTIFDLLPNTLNVNQHNLALVKALLVNSVSAELAAWWIKDARHGEKASVGWAVDSPRLRGLMAQDGVLQAVGGSQRSIQKKYRTPGRLMAYTWKVKPHGISPEVVFLKHASMVTPLMTILFSQTIGLDKDQVFELNKWLRLDLDLPKNLPSWVKNRAAGVLMELRKTIDRFVSLSWLELDTDPRERDAQKTVGPELRDAMIKSVAKLLEADEAYWQNFRLKRQQEIALEVERLKRDKEEEQVLLSQEDPPDEDDYEEVGFKDGESQEIESFDKP